jgi:uncharacterized protein (DUF1810 family)
MDDPYRLERFVAAQEPIYETVISELSAGRKAGHWMWFIFPQAAGLGRTSTSREFSISSLPEAQAYLRHPVLGPRLIECARILTEVEGKSAEAIFGSLDAMKLRSSMTLFMTAAPDEPIFADVLTKYFDGSPDQRTIELLLPQHRHWPPLRDRRLAADGDPAVRGSGKATDPATG